MKIKKIIKGIISIGAVGGIAYAAFKLGESNGEINERFRQKYDDDEDEYDFDDDEDGYNLYDEPDDECLAPASEVVDYNFTPIENVKGISKAQIKKLVLNIMYRKYVSNKTVRDILGVDYDKAAEVLKALENAGYIGADSGNHKMPVFLTYRDYANLSR